MKLIDHIHDTTDHAEINIELKLTGPLALSFAKECERRAIEPAALMADLIETIIEDQLYQAVLDD